MAPCDLSQPTAFRRAVLDILEERLSLVVPEPVLALWVQRALAEGLDPPEAAILICHAQHQLVAESWVEAGLMASELAEMVIADRIYESRKLVAPSSRDLQEILPDLPDLVRQPCFSGEFRDMVANTVSWDEMIASRSSSSDL